MPKYFIELGDISDFQVDAIVNAAAPDLLGGGGVDGAIHYKAGPELKEFCRGLGGAKTGEAKITPGFKLLAKYIIHTVGPVWKDGNKNEAELLKLCYVNCLDLAQSYQLTSIAFPAISTGAFGYPQEEACKIALETVYSYFKLNPNSSIKEIYFVCYKKESRAIYLKIAKDIKLI
jgi:O-acetyl-ADP-ribose deacetylase (regulator of RNase III)